MINLLTLLTIIGILNIEKFTKEIKEEGKMCFICVCLTSCTTSCAP